MERGGLAGTCTSSLEGEGMEDEEGEGVDIGSYPYCR